MFSNGKVWIAVFVGLIMTGVPCRHAAAFEPEDYEEAAGLAFAVHGNPASGSWEFGFEDGT